MPSLLPQSPLMMVDSTTCSAAFNSLPDIEKGISLSRSSSTCSLFSSSPNSNDTMPSKYTKEAMTNNNNNNNSIDTAVTTATHTTMSSPNTPTGSTTTPTIDVTITTAKPRPGKSISYFVRRIALLLPLTFPHFIYHGFVTHNIFPAMGILPLVNSCLLSALLLHRDTIASLTAPMEPLGAIDVFYADIGLALFDLVMLFASLWNLPGGYWNQSRSYLAYYCMMFLVLDMLLHCFFIPIHLFRLATKQACACTHCETVSRRATLVTASDYIAYVRENKSEP